MPAGTIRTSDELEMVIEHKLSPAAERVETPVEATPPAQPSRGDQLEEFSVPAENMPGEEMDLPAGEPPEGDSPHASSSSSDAPEPERPSYRLLQRERHPPRCMTYDQLGIPSCYSILPAPQMLPVYQAPGLVPWLPPLQPYYFQPSFMYGLQQA